LASGIDTFDTAYAYGTAEDVLGTWVQSRSLTDTVHVISKMKPHILNEYPDGTKAADVVRKELEKSLARLHVTSLEGYMFHSPYYIYLQHMVEEMQKARSTGIVKNIGVSVYDEAEALQAVELGVDYVQVPYNVFDQRLDSTDFFDTAKKNKVTVFARSPFLQGLLLMQPDRLPERLSYLRPYLEHFIEIIGRYHVSPLEASLLFVKEHCRADHIVFGVETLSQLKDDISAIENSASILTNGLISEIENSFKNLNRGAINPSLWSKIK